MDVDADTLRVEGRGVWQRQRGWWWGEECRQPWARKERNETQSRALGRATDSEGHWPPTAASSWPGEVGAAGPGPA